jgi:D-3-phosphoglycerate dehydrogenase
MKACYIDCSPFMLELMTNAGLKLPDNLHVHVGDPEPGQILDVIADADVVLNGHTYMDEALIAGLRSVKRIVFLGTGASSYIDVAAAERRSIEIKTVRGYGDRSVAEHAIALVMACSRQIARMDRQMRGGIWEPLGGRELSSQTIGIIGAGGIGLEVAKISVALGMKVLIWNRSALSGPWQNSQVPIERLLREADIISLHLALTPETQNFMDAARLGQMKHGATLINTARAGLVDEAALIAALESGHLAHAGLDVFNQEPLSPAHPFHRMDSVTLTSHAAYKTPEASIRLIAPALDLAFSA